MLTRENLDKLSKDQATIEEKIHRFIPSSNVDGRSYYSLKSKNEDLRNIPPALSLKSGVNNVIANPNVSPASNINNNATQNPSNINNNFTTQRNVNDMPHLSQMQKPVASPQVQNNRDNERQQIHQVQNNRDNERQQIHQVQNNRDNERSINNNTQKRFNLFDAEKIDNPFNSKDKQEEYKIPEVQRITKPKFVLNHKNNNIEQNNKKMSVNNTSGIPIILQLNNAPKPTDFIDGTANKIVYEDIDYIKISVSKIVSGNRILFKSKKSGKILIGKVAKVLPNNMLLMAGPYKIRTDNILFAYLQETYLDDNNSVCTSTNTSTSKSTKTYSTSSSRDKKDKKSKKSKSKSRSRSKNHNHSRDRSRSKSNRRK